ncbi:endolytic transglycosylase MltG [Terrilactibacillus laevilacticus]|uniref:endolytic transglycosylase MltG n=1 Tax=Terrilactibacillus laevilacticus TaxID=1380157 RepID=UPI001146ACB1|nr:endolytic transglycosylase MltG [Terrilactibacillus laevilacticus]
MTKNGMRGFSAGILIACAVFSFFYYFIFGDHEVTPKTNETTNGKVTEEAVANYLTKNNQIAVSQEDYAKWQKDLQSKNQEKTQSHNNDNSKDNPPKKEVNKLTLNITSGMVPGEIAEKLHDAKIIKSTEEFNKYFHTNNRENYIQLGKFNVNSDMSIPKIAQVITKNRVK